MDDLIGQINCGSKLDSIMMRMLRSAMDKAHEKLQFKDRPIEFLHEQTTFYELAAILVEGSLKIVEQDEPLQVLPSKTISDLLKIRERLVGRIRDMKRLIKEKDREFRERLENELRLREALEVTESESVQLYEKIGPGLMKMKDSVDEQVLNIKQKLEDEKMILDSEIRARSLDKGMLEDERMISNFKKKATRSHSNPNLCSYSLYCERRARRSHSNPNLSSDSMDKDRGLMLLEDEKMILNTEKKACSSSSNLIPCSLDKERGLVMLEDEKMTILNAKRRARCESRASSPNLNPEERGHQFLKQTLDLVLFGRMQLTLEKQWRKGIKREVESILMKGFVREFDMELKKRDGLVKDSWFDFIDEMKSLFHELKDFFSRNDVQPKSRRTNSEPNLDINFTGNLVENDEVGVWKIIKSHESIIRRQHEQRSLLTRDALPSSWMKRNEDINAMERLIQDAIVRLDNFTQRKHKLGRSRSQAQEKRRRIPKPRRRMDRTCTTIQSFEAEIKKVQEERDGLCFQISVIEDTYQLLFRGVMKDFSTYQMMMESAIREDILVLVFQEMVKQWNPQKEIILQDYTECLLREDILKIYLREMTEAWFVFEEEVVQNWRMSTQQDMLQDCLLREEIYKTYLREMTKSEARTPQSRRSRGGGDGESSLIQKVDSLLKSVELEEDLMLRASSLIKEHSASNSLVILDCEETEERDAIEWLITDDETTFCSVSEKLERALQQLHTTKELLAELEESLEDSDDDEYYQNSHFNNILRLQDQTTTWYHTDWSENVLAIIQRFRFLVDDVEVELHQNLDAKFFRLEALKRQVDALTQPVAWIKTRKLLYEKAFISRCRNLKLAETEVDLLGDQVETLLSLLHRIYLLLSPDARVLSTYFEVYEILKLIKIELNGGRSSNQNLQLQNINRIKTFR